MACRASSSTPVGPAPSASRSTTTSRAESLARARQAFSRGQFAESAQLCRQLLDRQPGNPDAHFLMGLLAGRAGHIGAAVKAFERVIDIDAQRHDARCQLARCLAMRGEHARAAVEAERLAASEIENPALLDTLGTVFSHLGLQEQALPVYRKALALAPEQVAIAANTAAAMIFLGHEEEAGALIRQTLAQDPGHVRSHWQLARLQRARDETHIQSMASLRKSLPADHPDRAYIDFAMGKELEDLGEWSRAWDCWAAGAELKRALVNYEVENELTMFARLQLQYDRDWWENRRPGVEDSAEPVFIIGLPRSGTTLVEQLLGAHPALQALGELPYAPALIKHLSGVPGPALMDSEVAKAAADIDPAVLGERYLQALAFRRDGRQRFTDKLPQNSLNVGLLAAALPCARFILVRRDPMDSALALFKQMFAEAYPWSYRLDELAAYLGAHHRLMAHWQTLLPDRLHVVDYETLVTDTEPEVRAMLDFLTLPFDSACIDPAAGQAAVATASASQARKPIHRASVGRWRKFGEQLEALRAALPAEVVAAHHR